MARLKLQTAEHHEAIERVVPLMDRSLDRARYARYLSAMHGVHEPIERALSGLAGLSRVVPDVEERRKLPLLARDLVALAVERPPPAPPGSLPPLDSLADALGVLYVLEGSTLGGRILSRHLASKLGVSPDSGGAYLASYGERLGPMWQRFGACVESFARESNARDAQRVVDAATSTFQLLAVWLKETGVGNA